MCPCRQEPNLGITITSALKKKLTILISSSGLTFHATRSAWARRNFQGCSEMSKYCLAFQVLSTVYSRESNIPLLIFGGLSAFHIACAREPNLGVTVMSGLKSMGQGIFSLLTQLKRIWNHPLSLEITSAGRTGVAKEFQTCVDVYIISPPACFLVGLSTVQLRGSCAQTHVVAKSYVLGLTEAPCR